MINLPMRFALRIIVVTAFAGSVHAQLLSDNFNGTSIDTSLWQVSTPFPNSSMTESGGNGVFENRGRLLSVASLPTSIDVTGSFEFTANIHDQFEVILRTNGVSTNPAGSLDNGIYFDFAIQSDTGDTANQIHIRDASYPNGIVELATGTFPMTLNTFYSFRITDDGTNLALYINDLAHPLLIAADSNSYGSQLGLNNREGNGSISAGSVSQLDFINVVLGANLHDNFNGTLINTSLWQISEPFSGASVTESGGNAIFDNRGRLITQRNYPAPFVMTGAFTITGASSDEFKLVIRTDGTFVNGHFGESVNGFMIRFRSSSFFADNEVTIQEIDGTAFSGWTGTLNVNTEYQFKIIDDGSNISVFFGDMSSPKATVSSTDSWGSKLAFYNREQTGPIMHETQLDYIDVTHEPAGKQIKSISKIGSTVTLTIDSFTNFNYQLQHADSLTSAFANIGSPQAGFTGTTLTLSDPNASGSAGFYRVIIPPQN